MHERSNFSMKVQIFTLGKRNIFEGNVENINLLKDKLTTLNWELLFRYHKVNENTRK